MKLGQKDETVLIEAYRCGLLPNQMNKALDSKQLLRKIKTPSKTKPIKVKKRCKKCGYVMSPFCSECVKRSHKVFEEMEKNFPLNEYSMTRIINLGN